MSADAATPSEVTAPTDSTAAMMYWHERAMAAESDLTAAREQIAALTAARGIAVNTIEDLGFGRAQKRVAELKAGLRTLIRAYVNTLENGRDRIIMLRGECDSLDQMVREDAGLRAARALLSPSPEPKP